MGPLFASNQPAEILPQLKAVLDRLSRSESAALHVLTFLLVQISRKSAVNKMTPENLVTCLAPTIGLTHYLLTIRLCAWYSLLSHAQPGLLL